MDRVFKHKGFGIVEVLIAAGILAVLILASTSAFIQQMKQTRHIGQKLEAYDLRQSIMRIVADSAQCKCMFQNMTFVDLGGVNIADVNVSNLKLGCSAETIFTSGTALSNSQTGLRIGTAQLTDLKRVNSTFYTADLLVPFIPESGMMAIQPVKVNLAFLAVEAGTLRTIFDCQASVSNVKDVCNAINGIYDPATNKCNLVTYMCNTIGGTLDAGGNCIVTMNSSFCTSLNGVFNPGTKTCTLSGWDSSQCPTGQAVVGLDSFGRKICRGQLVQNCFPGNKKSCSITNGVGEQTCLSDGSSYSSCTLVSCNAGYGPDGAGGCRLLPPYMAHAGKTIQCDGNTGYYPGGVGGLGSARVLANGTVQTRIRLHNYVTGVFKDTDWVNVETQSTGATVPIPWYGWTTGAVTVTPTGGLTTSFSYWGYSGSCYVPW